MVRLCDSAIGNLINTRPKRFRGRLSRVGVFPYIINGKLYWQYRPADEVFSEASVQSLLDASITIGHPDDDDSPVNSHGAVFSVTPNQAEGAIDGDFMTVTEQAESLARGGSPLSPMYDSLLREMSGRFEGRPYDLVQTGIRYSSLGLVGNARQGDSVRVFYQLSKDSAFGQSQLAEAPKLSIPGFPIVRLNPEITMNRTIILGDNPQSAPSGISNQPVVIADSQGQPITVQPNQAVIQTPNQQVITTPTTIQAAAVTQPATVQTVPNQIAPAQTLQQTLTQPAQVATVQANQTPPQPTVQVAPATAVAVQPTQTLQPTTVATQPNTQPVQQLSIAQPQTTQSQTTQAQTIPNQIIVEQPLAGLTPMNQQFPIGSVIDPQTGVIQASTQPVTQPTLANQNQILDASTLPPIQPTTQAIASNGLPLNPTQPLTQPATVATIAQQPQTLQPAQTIQVAPPASTVAQIPTVQVNTLQPNQVAATPQPLQITTPPPQPVTIATQTQPLQVVQQPPPLPQQTVQANTAAPAPPATIVTTQATTQQTTQPVTQPTTQAFVQQPAQAVQTQPLQVNEQAPAQQVIVNSAGGYNVNRGFLDDVLEAANRASSQGLMNLNDAIQAGMSNLAELKNQILQSNNLRLADGFDINTAYAVFSQSNPIRRQGDSATLTTPAPPPVALIPATAPNIPTQFVQQPTQVYASNGQLNGHVAAMPITPPNRQQPPQINHPMHLGAATVAAPKNPQVITFEMLE